MGRESYNNGVGRFIHLYKISVCAVQVKDENLFSRWTRTSYMLIEEMPLCYQVFCIQVETGCEYDIKLRIPVRNQNAIDIYGRFKGQAALWVTNGCTSISKPITT